MLLPDAADPPDPPPTAATARPPVPYTFAINPVALVNALIGPATPFANTVSETVIVVPPGLELT